MRSTGPEERRRRWNRRRGRRSVRWGTAAISRTAAPELDSEHLEGEGRTADRMVVVERRGELSNTGGDGSRQRQFRVLGRERKRESEPGGKRARGEGEHGVEVLSTRGDGRDVASGDGEAGSSPAAFWPEEKKEKRETER